MEINNNIDNINNIRDQVTIHKGLLKGSVTLPISKSIAHRVILATALSEITGQSQGALLSIEKTLENPAEDLIHTLDCGKKLVAHYKGNQEALLKLNCGDSGTTLRMVLPIACTLFKAVDITLNEGLAKRPITPLLDLMSQKGCQFEKTENIDGSCTIKCRGKFPGGACHIRGDISSQYISGLLYALPLSSLGGEIKLTTQLNSKPYVDMTLAILKDAGIKVWETCQDGHLTYTLLGKQLFQLTQHNISQGDWSAAGFFAVANALGCQVKMTNLEEDSLQGDKEIYKFINIICSSEDSTVNLEDHPDLFPILAVLASLQEKTTTFIGIERLKLKESDRIKSTKAMLQSLKFEDFVQRGGGHEPLSVEIKGSGKLSGGIVNSYMDHRIAMAAAIGACLACGSVTILNASCCSKSYPGFFEDFRNLGGKID